MASAGYSGTPLVRKLGYKPGMRIRWINEPQQYADLLGPLPGECHLKSTTRGPLDLIHLFCLRKSVLTSRLPAVARAMDRNGMLWISWPKKSGSITTDISESDVRSAGLDAGLVDVKIAAIDADWSGLKFVYRLEDR